ncbi:MAG: mevalonate kinase [Gammaproteobacteria bacterium]|nr:mevalonate kinase [Gammaproteobacteria bacterium]
MSIPRVPALYKASAPGSLMLLGEHAVLHDKQAMVLAVDRRIHVTLSPRQDKLIMIRSAVGNLECPLATLHVQKPFDFVITSILLFKPLLKQGFELEIVSDFSDKIGLGSSAAVSVAVLAVFYQWLGAPLAHPLVSQEPLAQWLFQQALQVIRCVQGFGSGADAAASVFGGVLLYQPSGPYPLKRFSETLPITVIYSGAKTPTAVVVAQVEALRARYPSVIATLYETMDAIVRQASLALDAGNDVDLGALMNMQNACLTALGVNNAALEAIIGYLRQQPGIQGAKISGSGLGDCVIALGNCTTADLTRMPGIKMDVSVSPQGVCYG